MCVFTYFNIYYLNYILFLISLYGCVSDFYFVFIYLLKCVINPTVSIEPIQSTVHVQPNSLKFSCSVRCIDLLWEQTWEQNVSSVT